MAKQMTTDCGDEACGFMSGDNTIVLEVEDGGALLQYPYSLGVQLTEERYGATKRTYPSVQSEKVFHIL